MKAPTRKSSSKHDLTDASYLDMLGEKSAELYVPRILKDIENFKSQGLRIVVPLKTDDLDALLTNTIRGLESKKLLDWKNTPDTRRQVFIEAWGKVMQKHGLM